MGCRMHIGFFYCFAHSCTSLQERLESLALWMTSGVDRLENQSDSPHTVFHLLAFWHLVTTSKSETASTSVKIYQYLT